MFVCRQVLAALSLSVGIAMSIHNLTEGFMIALPLYYATQSRTTAFTYAATIGGFSQPLGALKGLLLIENISKQRKIMWWRTIPMTVISTLRNRSIKTCIHRQTKCPWHTLCHANSTISTNTTATVAAEKTNSKNTNSGSDISGTISSLFGYTTNNNINDLVNKDQQQPSKSINLINAEDDALKSLQNLDTIRSWTMTKETNQVFRAIGKLLVAFVNLHGHFGWTIFLIQHYTNNM